MHNALRPSTSLLLRGNLVANAFADDLALELDKRQQHVEELGFLRGTLGRTGGRLTLLSNIRRILCIIGSPRRVVRIG
jgi:hypothetical protein